MNAEKQHKGVVGDDGCDCFKQAAVAQQSNLSQLSMSEKTNFTTTSPQKKNLLSAQRRNSEGLPKLRGVRSPRKSIQTQE